MRLIDADKLIKDLYFLYDDNGFVKNEESRKVLTTICEQPTAYDVNKVVEELEKLADNSNDHMYESYFDGKEDGIREAIEIVKHGGVGKG